MQVIGSCTSYSEAVILATTDAVPSVIVSGRDMAVASFHPHPPLPELLKCGTTIPVKFL